MKKVLCSVILLLSSITTGFSDEYRLGDFTLSLPDSWQVTKSGTNLFGHNRARTLFINGITFEDVSSMETAKSGALYLARDMLSGFTIQSETPAVFGEDAPALLITGRGSYRGLDSIVHLIVSLGGPAAEVLFIFGTPAAWTDNIILIANILSDIGLILVE